MTYLPRYPTAEWLAANWSQLNIEEDAYRIRDGGSPYCKYTSAKMEYSTTIPTVKLVGTRLDGNIHQYVDHAVWVTPETFLELIE